MVFGIIAALGSLLVYISAFVLAKITSIASRICTRAEEDLAGHFLFDLGFFLGSMRNVDR
jgi:hypothetical protein